SQRTCRALFILLPIVMFSTSGHASVLTRGGAPTGPGTVAAGDFHSCAITDMRTVKCWGDNHSGQLGNGSYDDSDVPVNVVGLTNVVAITAGGEHTCAVLDDGTARCWGDNFAGDLGNGGGGTSSSPVAVAGLSGAVGIAAGGQHTCALLDDGTARCWGRNHDGQLGDNSFIDR